MHKSGEKPGQRPGKVVLCIRPDRGAKCRVLRQVAVGVNQNLADLGGR